MIANVKTALDAGKPVYPVIFHSGEDWTYDTDDIEKLAAEDVAQIQSLIVKYLAPNVKGIIITDIFCKVSTKNFNL